VAHVRRGAHRLDQASEFLSRDHCDDTFEGPGSRGIKMYDARMRIRAAEESRVEESRWTVIVCICPLTCQETPIFPALDSCPHHLRSELFHVPSPCRSDTPSRMRVYMLSPKICAIPLPFDRLRANGKTGEIVCKIRSC